MHNFTTLNYNLQHVSSTRLRVPTGPAAALGFSLRT